MGEFKGIIYQVTNVINNKKYIGKSFTTTYNYSFERLLSRRKSQHKLQMLKENGQYFHRQLKKYGWDNFIWEIIDKSYNKHELNLKETFWIKNKNSYAPNGQGYNLTLGGDGSSILKCCKGNKRNPRCGGYVWRYLDEYENTEVS